MKAYIGPYLNYVGPFQIAALLSYVGVSKKTCTKLGGWLAQTWVNDVCEWIHDRRDRRVKVVLHKYDTWNAEVTIAYIAVPLLKQFKAVHKGSPRVANEDVPPELRGPENPPDYGPDAIDPKFHDRWLWVIDEMIWSLEQTLDNSIENDLIDRNDYAGLKEYEARMQRGLTLFGKYFKSLWD